VASLKKFILRDGGTIHLRRAFGKSAFVFPGRHGRGSAQNVAMWERVHSHGRGHRKGGEGHGLKIGFWVRRLTASKGLGLWITGFAGG